MHQRTWRTDLEGDPPPEVPTAYNETPFKTILSSNGRHPFEIYDFVKKTFHSISDRYHVPKLSNYQNF